MVIHWRENVHPYLSTVVLVWAIAITVVLSYLYTDVTNTDLDQIYFLTSPEKQRVENKHEQSTSPSSSKQKDTNADAAQELYRD